MPAAFVMRVVVAVAASILWASTGRAGEQIVEGVTAILLPGLLALARLLVELAAIVAVTWAVVLGVRRARRRRRRPLSPPEWSPRPRGGDRDSR
jgi:hypothetical protein